MTEVNIKDEAQKIVRGLASALKMSADSLCFCGVGKPYGNCCQNATVDKLVPAEKEFEAALKYRDSQGGQIVSVPVGLLNQFLQKGINKLPCLYPNCTAKPVSCHLIPQNVLRTSFGSHCLDYKMRDGTVQSDFIKVGVSIAGTHPAFCSTHDNELFREIDTLGDIASQKQQFLLALKAAAFSLRRTQIFLSLDSQVEIFRPVLLIRSGTTKEGQHYTLNINHLSEQYQRFRIAHTAFQHFVEILENEDWDSFLYLQRNIPYSGNLFYAGFNNPSHDLRKQRINTPHTPIHITLSVLARDGILRVFFASPNNGSKEAYTALFEQMETADDQTLVAVINTILTNHPEGLLLPDSLTLSNDDHAKMKALREHTKECLVSSSGKIFNLTDTSQSVQFVGSLA
jgi:hypothetical protein